MADHRTKKRKLAALMVNDLGGGAESDMSKMEDEVRGLSGEELNGILAERLDPPYPVNAEIIDRAQGSNSLRCSRRIDRAASPAPQM
jgi:hypothetical protein